MIDLCEITTGLEHREAGLWVADNQREVSYPAMGHQACFSVEDISFWFKHRNNVITTLVRKFLSGEIFFDIGGGNGCVAMALQRSGIDTVLVEPGRVGVLNAMQRGLKAVVQATLHDAGFRAESMGAAGLFDVLEHIESDYEFLRSLREYLRPGGRLFITVPSYNVLWSVDDENAGHYRRYTKRSLGARLTEAGFVVKYCSYFFSILVPAIFVFRSIPSRFGLRRSVSPTTASREHGARGGVAARLMEKCLNLELKVIRANQCIPAGSSCIAVAEKPGGNR